MKKEKKKIKEGKRKRLRVRMRKRRRSRKEEENDDDDLEEKEEDEEDIERQNERGRTWGISWQVREGNQEEEQEWLDKKDGFIFTSNVDGHFQKSGVSPLRIVECHGSINLLQCSANCNNDLYRVERLPFSTHAEPFIINGSLPKCKHCGGYVRPNILMFDDAHWNANLFSLQTERFDSWQYTVEKLGKKIVVVEIGAGKTIPTIRLQSEFMGCPIIRINSNFSDAKVNDGISLPVGGLEALIKIDDCLTKFNECS